MLLELPGYQVIKKIYEGHNSIVYSGMKLDDKNEAVIIKTPITKLPNTSAANRIKHEFAISQRIQSPYKVCYKELKVHPHYGYVLIEADDHSEVLANMIPENGFTVSVFLEIAIQLAQGLSDIHRSKIIHRDIKPNNIIINPITGFTKYIDFDNAITMYQLQSAAATCISAGTLSYFSPEQTNRVNRAIDYRTDFYSLGVTFYQLLCGKLPFLTNNILELIHCHIAEKPIPLHQISTAIPLSLSNIVMKLLEKDAEMRYQNAITLLTDLKRCADDWAKNKAITPFILGQDDISEYFNIPQKLYGRETELGLLRDAVDRISALSSRPEICLVLGPPGIGKTVLVNEIQPAVVKKKGYFLSGKFDQLNRNTAYSALTDAIRNWVKQVLAYGEKEVIIWKKQLQQALGNNAQLMIELIPELELIIDKQPFVQALDPIQSKNRFHQVFQNLLSVLATFNHPIVLFLDDWQWADSASLQLLEVLMKSPDINNFLLIGAYRDMEVNQMHPAAVSIEAMRQAGVPLSTTRVLALDLLTVNQWISDATKTSNENTLPIVQLAYEKTEGNPFFIKMFFQTIYEQGLLYITERQWQWDLEKIRQQPATDNVMDLMANKIQSFSSATQNALSLASCIGHQFDFNTLEIITQKTNEELIIDLQQAVEGGLLIQKDNVVTFVHDKIQEAAYKNTRLEDRIAVHLTIGRMLQDRLTPESSAEHFFAVVNHLNQGWVQIKDKIEQFNLLKLNIQASRKAKQSIAYSIALNHLHMAEQILAEVNINNQNSAEAFDLFKELAEVEYLNGNLQESKKYIDIAQDHTTNVLEKVEIYNLLIIQKTLAAEYQTSIQIGCLALELLGVNISAENIVESLNIELFNVQENLKNKTMDMLLEAPLMENNEKKAIIKLLNNLAAPAYISDQILYALITAMMVNYTVIHGNTEEAAMAYGVYSILLCSKLDNRNLGHDMAILAIKLSDRFQSPVYQCKTNFIYANFVHHWTKPLSRVTPYIYESERTGLEGGEFQFLGYLSQYKPIYFFYSGATLSDISTEIDTIASISYNANNQLVMDIIHALKMVILNLSGQVKNFKNFNDDEKNDNEYQEDWHKNRSFYALANYLVLKVQALYFHGEFEEALKIVNSAQKYVNFISGHYAIAQLNYFHSLLLTTLYLMQEVDLQDDYWQQLELNQQQLKKWADDCPENFLYKYKIIKAEMHRIKGDVLNALSSYDEAINLLRDSELTQEIALANELAANFWLTQNKRSYAEGPLLTAYRNYYNWGAKYKTDNLLAKHGDLLKAVIPNKISKISFSGETSINAHNIAALDFISIIKASQLISGDIDLEKFLAKMMKIVIETAGAERGVFLLMEEGKLFIQAEYKIDGEITTLQAIPFEAWTNGVCMAVEYVKRTQKSLILDNAIEDKQFKTDPYVLTHQVKSLFCMSIIKHHALKGMLYLENNLSANVFVSDRVQTLMFLGNQIATSLENIKYFKEQLKASEKIAEIQHQAQILAEIDRAKTIFLSNISHEFRTPLTLMLGPLEDSFTDNANPLNSRQQERQQLIYRNALRLLKLVNALLDFSRIEANRVQAIYEPTNLAEITADLVSMFRATIEKSGLKLIIETLPLAEPVYVDKEMYEKIIFNLLSNAAKFTFTGFIKVLLRKQENVVELRVQDSGVGIPEKELPHIFERFHRVEDTKSRSYEGSGIGLAIVQELVKAQGGTIHVESTINQGTTFIINFPFGTAHLAAEKLGRREFYQLGAIGAPYITEVANWMSTETTSPSQSSPMLSVEEGSSPNPPLLRPKILVVDDNIDMCKYLRTLLQPFWQVETVYDGEAALAAIESKPPDLILTDLMMPKINGLQLIQHLKSASHTQLIPIILLSARTTKEAHVEGLNAGADDYVDKPFVAKELIARIRTHLEVTRLRQQRLEIEKELATQTVRAAMMDEHQKKQADFVDTLCHEVRNPLGAAISAHTLLIEEVLAFEQVLNRHSNQFDDISKRKLQSSVEKIKEYIQIIEICNEQQRIIVNDVLDLSKIENRKFELNPTSFNLKKLIHDVTQMFKGKADKKHVELILELPDLDIELKADVTRLKQIIGNLLDNAIKFTSVGTVIIQIWVDILANNEAKLAISIKDTGIGMSSEEMARLFDKFVQANRRTAVEYGGSGMGLSISKQLIERMKGAITVKSTENKGSEFHFFIYCETLSPQEKLAIENQPAFSSQEFPVEQISPKKKILIVEDNSINRTILTKMLYCPQFTCESVENGLQALEKYQQSTFDIILMDVQMPVMDGLTATQQIRQIEKTKGGHVPIIGLSGNVGKKHYDQAIAAGMNSYLPKPYTKTELLDVITQFTALAEVETQPISPLPSSSSQSSNPQKLPSALPQFERFLDSDRDRRRTSAANAQDVIRLHQENSIFHNCCF